MAAPKARLSVLAKHLGSAASDDATTQAKAAPVIDTRFNVNTPIPEGSENIVVDGERITDGVLLTAQDDGFAFRNLRKVTSIDTLKQLVDDGLDPSTPAFYAAAVLPGHPDIRNKETRVQLVADRNRLDTEGVGHVGWMDTCLAYGKQGASSNVVIPMVLPPIRGKEELPRISNVVLLVHPDDAERISHEHVRKNPRFNLAFGDSIIGTMDNKLWKEHRSHMNPAMDVIGALADVFPLSVEISEQYAAKLHPMAGTVVNIHEHLMATAMVQLQKALFGMTDEFTDKYNGPLRQLYTGENGNPKRGDMSKYLADLLKQINARGDTFVSTEQRAEQLAATGGITGTGEGNPVRGPLGEVLLNSDMTPEIKFANAQLLSFAGHDTTGNTMTFLVWELSKRPDLQKRMHDEVDALFAELAHEGRSMQYRDCHKLPFLTRCTMETLRLWPAVPWGSHRQLEHDDWVTGPDGEKVWLKAGTPYMPVNWVRHRNPDLWGPDVNEFNPDREFEPAEIWNGKPFAAWNPSSKRFSPFTYSPRSCFGMNFAHMEIRTVLAHLFRDFRFVNSSINPPSPDYLGVTKFGTLGPADNVRPPDVRPGDKPGTGVASKKLGCYVHVELRRPRP